MAERKTAETAADEFEEKLRKLIKRAKKQHGMLWPSVISKLELARADVRSMIKVYDSGPK
jgi:predicted small metal-binding protein